MCIYKSVYADASVHKQRERVCESRVCVCVCVCVGVHAIDSKKDGFFRTHASVDLCTWVDVAFHSSTLKP